MTNFRSPGPSKLIRISISMEAFGYLRCFLMCPSIPDLLARLQFPQPPGATPFQKKSAVMKRDANLCWLIFITLAVPSPFE